jgi:hypothetical protein
MILIKLRIGHLIVVIRVVLGTRLKHVDLLAASKEPGKMR